MRPLSLAAALVAAVSAHAAGRPNVLVILTDDQRPDTMSCAGHPFMNTPHFDRLAAEGARFRNTFVTTSLCSPSRASFLSGLYAHTHKVLNNFTDYPVKLASYPRILQKGGYETAYIGKWHMGEQSDVRRPGFDYWMSHKGQGNYYDNTFNINGERRMIKGYYTKTVTDYAVKYIQQKRSKPFMLILGQKAPHGGPIVPEKKYETLFDDVKPRKPFTITPDRGKPKWLSVTLPTWHGINGPKYGLRDFDKFIRYYHGTIQSVDDSVGRIYEALKQSAQLDNTLFIFTSDNGFALGEHGRVDKRTAYEESLRVPLIVRYPKLAKAGTLIDEMVLNIDLAPTIVDICGLGKMKNVHGRSFKPLLQRNPKGWRKAWHYEYNYEKQFPFTPNVRAVRTKEWKYIRYPHGDGGPDRHKAELYNLTADPLERVNLIDRPGLRGKVREMRAMLKKLQEQTGGLPDEMPVDAGVKNITPKF